MYCLVWVNFLEWVQRHVAVTAYDRDSRWMSVGIAVITFSNFAMVIVDDLAIENGEGCATFSSIDIRCTPGATVAVALNLFQAHVDDADAKGRTGDTVEQWQMWLRRANNCTHRESRTRVRLNRVMIARREQWYASWRSCQVRRHELIDYLCS